MADEPMADFKTRLEGQLVGAAARPRRGRYARSPLPTPPLPWLAATAAAVVLAAVLAWHSTSPDHAAAPPEIRTRVDTTPRANAGFERQLKLLSVLRGWTRADNDPQVHAAVRAYTRLGMPVRTRYARLLGKAPGGDAFVLLPVLEFDRRRNGRRPTTKTVRDGLCLVRRGSQGGAGQCVTSAELAKGALWYALAGQVYGAVPDAVAAVRPAPGAKPVKVKRNFFVYPAPEPTIPAPVYLDAQGRELNLGGP